VTELAAVPARAAVEAPVDDDAAADPGRDREVDHVAHAGAGAPAVLAGRRGGRVVLERDRALERAQRELVDRHVAPAGQVRGRDQDAALGVERAAAADADRLDGRPRDARLLDRFPSEREQVVEHRVHAELGAARPHDERMRHAVAADDASGELRPADVQREHRSPARGQAQPL
jgi:hypothetical protein